MKNLIAAIVAIAVVVVVALMFFKPKDSFKDAGAAESRGEYAKARDLYVAALNKATEGMKLPDKNRSKLVSPQEWYGEVQQYMAWISGPPATASAQVSKIIVALKRCSTFVENEQYTTDDSVSAYAEQFMAMADWRRAFFPAGVTVEGDHTPLVEQAMQRDISILRITSLTSYAYTASLLDLSSWRRTDFTLAPEDEVSLLVRPGKYMLICSSEVEFPDGTLWRSGQNILDVEAPGTSAFKTFVLKTQVKR